MRLLDARVDTSKNYMHVPSLRTLTPLTLAPLLLTAAVTRKMFGALAEEKNVEQAKALAANAKVSKLESKLGLAIGRTGLAKKNSSLRENVRKLKDDLNDMQQKFKSQEDDLVRACSEIKVLERSLQIKQNELDGSGSGSAAPESGRKPPIREQLLYQLALKKEEEVSRSRHNCYRCQG